MRVTTELLKQFGDISAKDSEYEKLIKEHIANVEYVHDLSKDYEGIVIGEIVEKEEHPNADKLGVYKVFIGNKRTQVVAGDKTLCIGDKVAYLPPGSYVPYTYYSNEKPVIIEAVELRGVKSNGMLGSEKELNLGPNHNNVFRLPQEAPVGEPFSEYYNLNDTVIEIENKGLTNRGDLFGILGIARELTAITGNKFLSPTWILKPQKKLHAESNCLNLEIINDAEALCPRYIGIAIDNISIKPSPIWLQSELVKLDIKPINNVIDITNYISAILGQPLHAFDYAKIISNDNAPDNKVIINIRMGKEGETILGLDNKLHELNDRTIVIADNSHPIAIAGIIGGKDSSVDASTKRIIIESANFDKNSIRKSSMNLGIHTDSATKFKHSLDPEMCLPALIKAVQLIKELASGNIASNIIDIYPDPQPLQKITTDIDKLNRHLGTSLSKDVISTILTNLEYTVTSSDKTFLTVKIPSWRKDIQLAEDIHEDIARIYGFDNIDITLPKKEIRPIRDNKIFELKKKTRKLLSTLGLNEILTYSFIGPESFNKSNLDSNLAFKLKNPLSPELSLMRTNLLQTILPKVKENRDRGFKNFGLFEINIPHVKGYFDTEGLPKEEWHVSSIITNTQESKHSPFYIAKKYAKAIFSEKDQLIKFSLIAESLEQNIDDYSKATMNMFDPNVSAFCYLDKEVIGIVGELKENILLEYKLPQNTCAFDINLSKLVSTSLPDSKMKPVSIYPNFSIDLCLESNLDIKYSEIEDFLKKILNSAGSWGNTQCLDIYRDEKIPEKKRITFRIEGGENSKTLTDKEIKEKVSMISKKLNSKFGIKVI
mgnify:FL=1